MMKLVAALRSTMKLVAAPVKMLNAPAPPSPTVKELGRRRIGPSGSERGFREE